MAFFIIATCLPLSVLTLQLVNDSLLALLEGDEEHVQIFQCSFLVKLICQTLVVEWGVAAGVRIVHDRVPAS